ncbi:cytochrome P450 52A11 [Colletotrichum truncatum]|uniref:Cytochrome P450 52A11 n=1 Tax=Colletotrichum truncatum TaxID=5467 RepID=A0ACC3Z227_COLTU|nr:cytochrome P450 52A11 [Colletotrichum truncatum]KAF6781696.1 cytochrome P450 52A11 [Colletotrichum truncatum]
MLTGSSLAALIALSALFCYLYHELHYRRIKQFAHYPQMKPSLIWGHLKLIKAFHRKRGEKGGHIDHVFGDICESMGNPPVLLLDFRPLNSPVLLVRSHEISEQITRQSKMWPYSTPKADTAQYLTPLIGENSMIILSGPKWKDMRKHFNLGFAPQHLMTLLPLIMDKTQAFLSKLDSLASTGEVFDLDPLCTNLTFDIIGAVTMGVDLDAQLPEEQQGDFIRNYKALLQSYKEPGILKWRGNPLIKRRRRVLSQAIDSFLAEIVRHKFDDIKEDKGLSSRSILELSLKEAHALTKELIDNTIDQLKTFMFAGHDTTSIVLQWAIYELSRTPHAIQKLRLELEELFGPSPNPAAIRNTLKTHGGEIINDMIFTSAVIKETLRLYPPAGSARLCPPGSNFHIQLPDGSNICVDGIVLYNCATLVQRDANVYGNTKDDFLPERWLDNRDTPIAKNKDKVDISGAGEGIPASAWRPFGRGPRKCIGQELANIEAKVILACVISKYDFEKVGLGEAMVDTNGKPIVNEKGQYHSKTQLYNTQQITARPVDYMRVRVRLRHDLS